MYKMSSADIIEVFYNLRIDIDKLVYATTMSQMMNDVCFEIYLRNKWNLDIFHENIGINECFETGIFKKRHKTLDSVWVV